MTGRPTFSIVIVNWNGGEALARCLASLRAQTWRPQEVTVVDNDSSDGSAATVRECFPEVRLLAAERNLGFASGCNRGIAASSGDWVVTLNNDACATETFLEEGARAIAHGTRRMGMIQPRIVTGDLPARTSSTGLLLFTDGCAFDRDAEAPFRQDDAPGPVFCPTAGAAFYRRSMLDEIRLPSGWFDGGFFMYVEDLDLGWRCRLAGWEAVYWPSALVQHRPHGSSSRKGRFFVRVQCKKNRLRTLVKNGSPAFLARGLPRTVADFVRIPLMGGPLALAETLRGLAPALRERRLVARFTRVGRREVERAWAGKRPPELV